MESQRSSDNRVLQPYLQAIALLVSNIFCSHAHQKSKQRSRRMLPVSANNVWWNSRSGQCNPQAKPWPNSQGWLRTLDHGVVYSDCTLLQYFFLRPHFFTILELLEMLRNCFPGGMKLYMYSYNVFWKFGSSYMHRFDCMWSLLAWILSGTHEKILFLWNYGVGSIFENSILGHLNLATPACMALSGYC